MANGPITLNCAPNPARLNHVSPADLQAKARPVLRAVLLVERIRASKGLSGERQRREEAMRRKWSAPCGVLRTSPSLNTGSTSTPPEDFAGVPTLQYFSFETGESETILRAEKPLWGSIAISPDRGSLLYSQIDSAGSDLVLKLPVTVAWRAERAVYQLKPKLQRFEYARHTGKHRRHVGWPRRAQAEPENAGLGSGMKQFLQVGFFHGPQRIARSLHTRCNSFRGACSLTANSVSDRFRYLGLAPPGCSWFAACAAEVLVRPLA